MQPTSFKEIRFIVVAVAVAVVMLTGAISYGIVHKVNNGDDIVAIAKSNADQAKTQSDEIAALRGQLETQAKSFRYQLTLARRQSSRQAASQRRQNATLIRALRDAGIPVPRSAVSGGGSGSPKVPRPTNRATPTPTVPTPTADPTCFLFPLLCGLPLGLPTLLP